MAQAEAIPLPDYQTQPRSVEVVVLSSANRALLLRRGQEVRLPGGDVLPHEDYMTAAERIVEDTIVSKLNRVNRLMDGSLQQQLVTSREESRWLVLVACWLCLDDRRHMLGVRSSDARNCRAYGWLGLIEARRVLVQQGVTADSMANRIRQVVFTNLIESVDTLR